MGKDLISILRNTLIMSSATLLFFGVDYLYQNEIPLKPLNNLEVNTNISYRGYKYMNREEGLEELIELSKISKKEESWLFLPDKNLWIENATFQGENYAIISNFAYDAILGDSKEYYAYHIHNRPDLKLENYNWPDSSLVPSRADIIVMINRSSKLYRKFPDGKSVHGMVSPAGIVEYNLTKEGREYFKNFMTAGQISSKDIPLLNKEKFISNVICGAPAYLRNWSKSIEGTCKLFKIATNNLVEFKYIPSKKVLKLENTLLEDN